MDGAIDQIGYVVDDLDAAMAGWRRSFGLGPWTVFRNVVLDGAYRGLPARVCMDVALAYRGGVQIELIRPTCDARSPYRAADGRLLAGLHHVARIVPDLETALAEAAARGLAAVFRAGNAATQVAYLELPGTGGALFELIAGAGMREMCDAGIAAARDPAQRDAVTIVDLAPPA